MPQEPVTIRRILSVSSCCYLDDADAVAFAHHALVDCLTRHGFTIEILAGTIMTLGRETDPAAWLTAQGRIFEAEGLAPVGRAAPMSWPHPPSLLRLEVDGVPVRLFRGPTTLPHEPDEDEGQAFLYLLDAALERFRPDVLVYHGADRLAPEILRRARSRGVATALRVVDGSAREPGAFELADAVLVSSRFLADFYRDAFGRACEVFPDLVDSAQLLDELREPGCVMFLEPTTRNGLHVFARIADELGRRRPDIPLLVAGRGADASLDRCGLDLKSRANVRSLSPGHDIREVWTMTRVALMPSLAWDAHPRRAAEALALGVPVVASDRGALPEIVEPDGGIILPLPDRLTPAMPSVPTAEEVAPWVESVISLWDGAECRSRIHTEAQQWTPEILGPRYVEVFRTLQLGPRPSAPVPHLANAVVLVPHLNGIVWGCEQSLRKLEDGGVKVVRSEGSSQIDVARNQLASDALHDGHESILFIDADIGFEPADALRLLARPEPVICGVYAKKSRREMASVFPDGVAEVRFGVGAGPYPLKYAAAGFLRVRADVLRRMADALGLPLCNRKWGRGVWPFFQPLVVPHPECGHHYLGEDWAFSHRLGLIGITPLADTSIRLWHYGTYGYGWEDAGANPRRSPTYNFLV